MMHVKDHAPAIMAVLLLLSPAAFASAGGETRSGIEFTFANPTLVQQDGTPWLSLDVMASGQSAGQRIGTGIAYLNYNPQVFGQNVSLNDNAIIERDELLLTAPFPFYNLILNDNTPSRLAVTFEYLYSPGSGGLLESVPRSLLNVRLRILNPCFAAGISFQQDLMQGEQYLDDNATLFDPVVAADEENDVVPATPEALQISMDGGILSLSWQECAGCFYTVFSADDPNSGYWQPESGSLFVPYWESGGDWQRKFFRVTATGLPGTRGGHE